MKELNEVNHGDQHDHPTVRKIKLDLRHNPKLSDAVLKKGKLDGCYRIPLGDSHNTIIYARSPINSTEVEKRYRKAIDIKNRIKTPDDKRKELYGIEPSETD